MGQNQTIIRQTRHNRVSACQNDRHKPSAVTPNQKTQYKNPKWLTVVKIAEALGVSLDEFKE